MAFLAPIFTSVLFSENGKKIRQRYDKTAKKSLEKLAKMLQKLQVALFVIYFIGYLEN